MIIHQTKFGITDMYILQKNKYFGIYKNFFIDKIKNKKIQTIYVVKPMFGVSNPLEFVLDLRLCK